MADETTTPSKSKNFLAFFTTLPGVITALTGLITAVGGFLLVVNKTGCSDSKEAPRIDTIAVQPPAADSTVAATGNISYSPAEIKHITRNLIYKIAEANAETMPDKQVVFMLKVKCVNDSKYEYNFYAKYIRVKVGEDSYPPGPYSPSGGYEAITANGFKNLEYNYKLPAGIKKFSLAFYDENDEIGSSLFTMK
jgi:hypothetical protein